MLAKTLKKVITDEINLRVGDAHTVEQSINTVRRNLNRLRQAVCADFYNDNFKTQLQKPYHRNVKNTFSGKRPASHVIQNDEADIAASSSHDATSIHQIPTWLDGEVTNEMVEAERPTAIREDDYELQQMRYLDPEEKSQLEDDPKNRRPRYVPPVMPAEKIQRSIEPRGDRPSMKIRILVRNTSKYIHNRKHTSGETHRWTVFVTLNDSSLSIGKIVSKAIFYLHPTYEPNDIVTVKSAPFKITRRGWGEFDIRVKLFFFDERDEPADIIHSIRLDTKHSGMETFGGETICDHYISDLSASADSQVKSAPEGIPSKEEENFGDKNLQISANDAKYSTGKSPVKPPQPVDRLFYNNDDLLNCDNLSIPDLFDFDDDSNQIVVKTRNELPPVPENDIDSKICIVGSTNEFDRASTFPPCSIEIDNSVEEKPSGKDVSLNSKCLQEPYDNETVPQELIVPKEIVIKSEPPDMEETLAEPNHDFGLTEKELYMSDLLECHNEVVISETPVNNSLAEIMDDLPPATNAEPCGTNNHSTTYQSELNSVEGGISCRTGHQLDRSTVVDYNNVEIDDLIKFPSTDKLPNIQLSSSLAETKSTYSLVSTLNTSSSKTQLTSSAPKPRGQNSGRQTLLISAEDWAAILKKNTATGQPVALQRSPAKIPTVRKASPKKVAQISKHPRANVTANKRVSKLSTLLSGPSLTAPRILPSTSFSVPVNSTPNPKAASPQAMSVIPNRTIKVVTAQAASNLPPKSTAKLVTIRPAGTHLLVKMPDGTVKPVEALKPLKPYVLKTPPGQQPVKVAGMTQPVTYTVSQPVTVPQSLAAKQVKLQPVVQTNRQLVNRKRTQPTIIRGSVAKKHCPDGALNVPNTSGAEGVLAARSLPVLLPRLPAGRVVTPQQRLLVSSAGSQAIRLATSSSAAGQQQPTYVIFTNNEARQLTVTSRLVTGQPTTGRQASAGQPMARAGQSLATTGQSLATAGRPVTTPAVRHVVQGSPNVLLKPTAATPKLKLQEVENDLEVKNPYALECERKISECPKGPGDDQFDRALSWLLSCFPLIDKRATDPKFREVHPYCAASFEIFQSWPLAKRLSREFHRANDVLKEIRKVFPGRKISKKDVVNFARRRAYTIYDLKKIDPECVSYSFPAVQSLTVRENVESLVSGNDEPELEVDVETVVSSSPSSPVPSVRPEVADRKGKVFMTLAPFVDDGRAVENLVRTASIHLEPEEIVDGVNFPAALRTLMSAFRSFVGDLVRRTYDVAHNRYRDATPEEILPGDVIQALFSRPEFDLFTDQGLGRLPKPS